MASCLGLYIESNLIKYAKVTRDKDLVKVEAFGVKFYDKLGPAIDQIVSETFSYKAQICINLSDEMYEYFYFFNLLSKNDMKKAIDTEFESYCKEKGYNRNVLETRYSLVQDVQDKEKVKAIFISSNKSEINRRVQDAEGNNISNIFPLPMCMPNLLDIKNKENILIVNMEGNTSLTTIIEGNIYSVDKIEEGMDSILYSISEKENSYSKAYEICKNTTIYTMEGKELLQEEDNSHLEDIMPTLFNIVQKVREFVDNSINKIDKIYITGTGAIINNIDLYFDEYFTNISCEILKPYFINDNVKINIKDYIEVNSAIALAMQGVGYGVKNINFKKQNLTDKMPEWMKITVGSKKDDGGAGKKKIFGNFSFSLKGEFDRFERWLLRTASGLLAFLIIYIVITTFLRIQTETKLNEVQNVIADTQTQISAVKADITSLNTKKSSYDRATERLKNYNSDAQNKLSKKNVIPVLLTRIMNVIPKGVILTEIQNTTDKHIVIKAQSADYDLLGFFKSSIIVDGILKPSTVISTSGIKENGVIRIVIEGDLP